jgi:ketosteroid isomerase-like protein
MITKESALAFAQHWVESWNSHDLEKILSHYSDDFEMTTPFIVSIMNEPSGTLHGKDKVGAYWSNALKKFPKLEFKLIDVLYSVNSITIYYHSILNKKAVEFFLFDADGKVSRSIAHYDQA